MEVFVTVEAENLYTGEIKLAQTAFFTMVAIDKYGKPTPVPQLEFSNEPFVRALYFEGQRRYDSHRNKGRRKGE
jgi:acyl-CoA hydrolase